MRSFQTNKSVNKTNASDGLFKPVTQQNLPQNRNQAVRNTNVLKPGMYRIASTTTQTRTPQLPHASRNTNPHMSKSSGVNHTTSVSRPQLKSQGNDLLNMVIQWSDLYTISLQETTSSTLICFMAKASPTQAWLWHRRLSHLNFDCITLLSKKDVVNDLPKLKYVKDQLCSSCEMSKAKISSFKAKAVPSETPEVLKEFSHGFQRNLQASRINVRTDRGTEFLNKTLHAYFKEEGIEHQTSTP
ncbi:retrovirus-related pol polyprotein from transposon TNT 1-94 [Tanacetum coccineum]